MDKEKVFVKGLIFKAPRDGAPDFIKGSLSLKCAELLTFMQEHQKDGWINVDLKVSKGGKYYAELNTWEPKKKESAQEAFDGIPF